VTFISITELHFTSNEVPEASCWDTAYSQWLWCL